MPYSFIYLMNNYRIHKLPSNGNNTILSMTWQHASKVALARVSSLSCHHSFHPRKRKPWFREASDCHRHGAGLKPASRLSESLPLCSAATQCRGEALRRAQARAYAHKGRPSLHWGRTHKGNRKDHLMSNL